MKLQSFRDSLTSLSVAILNEAVEETSLLNLLFCLAQYLICPGEILARKKKLNFCSF